MKNKQKINIDTWERKEHFHLFTKFGEPFWGLCANVDVTRAYKTAKAKGYSFYLYYLHCSLAAVNSIEHFRYRIIDNEVYLYDTVHATPTVGKNNNSTYGVSFIPFSEDFLQFQNDAKVATAIAQASSNIFPEYREVNTIHYSAVPWIQFTGLSHARHFEMLDTSPKISFGKTFTQDEKMMMPVSVHGHHSLIDGYHAGLFLEKFQELLNRL